MENRKRIFDKMKKLNVHIDHIEDLIFLHEGEFLTHPYETFKLLLRSIDNGKICDGMKLSIKMDGSPAVTCFSDFGPDFPLPLAVSTKSMLNKRPITCFTDEDIDYVFGDKPDMCHKLKLLLRNVPALNIPQGEIWQGDFLFDDKGLCEVLIDDKTYVTFQPNIIIYALEKDVFLREYGDSKDIDVVFHTKYEGNSFDDLHMSHSKKHVPAVHNNILSLDPTIEILDHNFTVNETNHINYLFEELLECTDFLKSSEEYVFIVKNKLLVKLLALYQNHIIKENIDEFILEDFYEFMHDRYFKDYYSKKTENGKNKTLDEWVELITLINLNRDIIRFMMNVSKNIVRLKKIFLDKLNENVTVFETFIKMKDGTIKRTMHEGFVVTLNDALIKLVDRREFSRLNFSDDIDRGWKC